MATSEFAESGQEGPLAVGTGLQVLQEMMAEVLAAACEPTGTHDPARIAVRNPTEAGSVTGYAQPVDLPR